MPKVWSERRPGAWDQCTEGAYLMALHAAGFRAFPAGAYTDAERDALDAATPPDPDTGGSTFALLDAGAWKRYGRTLHRIPIGGRGDLRRQLRTPGLALAIAGSLGSFPAGHRLRRWQPDYIGGHAVAVVTGADGRHWWGDPLAPMGDEGDTVSTEAVLTFAWYPSDARVAVRDSLKVPQLRRRARTLAADNAKLAAELAALDPAALRARVAELMRQLTELAADLED